MVKLSSDEYYLAVVKSPEKPEFPQDEGKLQIYHQDLGNGFIQYWAFPSSEDLNLNKLPPAEIIASENPADEPVLLIDQPSGSLLELIIAKDAHAWSRTLSDLNNLDENISSILNFAQDKFNFKIEHFLTTKSVSPLVEKKLDEIVSNEEQRNESEEIKDWEIKPIKAVGSQNADNLPKRQFSFSFLSIPRFLIPVFILLILGGVIFTFKEKIIHRLKLLPPVFNKTIPAPSPANGLALTPTPTLIPLNRGSYSVRVLNGTMKTGAAKALAGKLHDLGWQILSAGNAQNQNTPQTLIKAKKELEQATQTLIKDLSASYTASLSADLLSSDKADLEVVIGKE